MSLLGKVTQEIANPLVKCKVLEDKSIDVVFIPDVIGDLFFGKFIFPHLKHSFRKEGDLFSVDILELINITSPMAEKTEYFVFNETGYFNTKQLIEHYLSKKKSVNLTLNVHIEINWIELNNVNKKDIEELISELSSNKNFEVKTLIGGVKELSKKDNLVNVVEHFYTADIYHIFTDTFSSNDERWSLSFFSFVDFNSRSKFSLRITMKDIGALRLRRRV